MEYALLAKVENMCMVQKIKRQKSEGIKKNLFQLEPHRHPSLPMGRAAIQG